MNYLISFGDDYFNYKKQILKKQAEDTGWFDKVIIHSPETLSNFFIKHKDFVTNSRGYGYWIWKPYIILDLLEKINEGDNIFYIDSGGCILKHRNKRFEEYLEMLNSTPILVFCDGGSCGNPPDYKEKYFQKMKVLKRFSLENDENFLNSGQIEGGVFICKKSQESINFVKEWLNLVTEDNYSLVNDDDDFEQLNEYKGHRHDQSILSILSKRKKVNILGLIDTYGMGPFFSSRMSDNGLRMFAPDGFRKQPDYDNTKHLNWQMYLNDDVIQKTINEIKQLIIYYGQKLNFCDINVDIKNQFVQYVMPKIEEIQYGKGFYKIYLSFDDSPDYIKQSKEILVGEFSCEFYSGNTQSFNFEITSGEVIFPEVKSSIQKLYKSEYIRTWIE
jgi:hypothetical protein